MSAIVQTFVNYNGQYLTSSRVICQLSSHSAPVLLLQEAQLQIFHSILDQIYHGKDFTPLKLVDVLEQTQNKYYGIPYVQNTVSLFLV